MDKGFLRLKCDVCVIPRNHIVGYIIVSYNNFGLHNRARVICCGSPDSVLFVIMSHGAKIKSACHSASHITINHQLHIAPWGLFLYSFTSPA
jgi:hypothetical protein